MPDVARYLSHPQVSIDPDMPIHEWGLAPVGIARVETLIAGGALNQTIRVISSQERKATQTADKIALALRVPLEINEAMGENDRSATGFLPPVEFEATADAFFANPDQSIRGWETAKAAQQRIAREIQGCIDDHPGGDILFVGHGAVGTLLWCHLTGTPISRQYDQGPGGGGCWFEWDLDGGAPKSLWQPMETLIR